MLVLAVAVLVEMVVVMVVIMLVMGVVVGVTSKVRACPTPSRASPTRLPRLVFSS